MNKVSISLVRTPFQLFNCIEATRKFNENGFNVLICIYKNEIDKKLFKEIMYEVNWKEIYFFKLNLLNKIFYAIKLNKILKKFKEVEYCFFGLITSYNIHAINQINAKTNILIDDGNETFLIANNIKNNNFQKKFKINLLNKILKKQFNLEFLKNLKFFTFFDLNSYLLNNIITKNDYSNFKKSISTLSNGKEIFFIGTNLINTYIDRKYFEEIIKNTIEYFKGYKIIYIPHRYEDISYLEKLSLEYSFELKKFSTILELAIFKYGKKPLGLITIRSTALETLSYLYDIEFLNVIELDKMKLLKDYQVIEYENLYVNYKNKKIPLIKVN
ncbi:MAG: hypothetical protein AB7S49_00585 [Arcobacter sp.]|uniref:hypothetical protein n=1 Tax=Arcobacter sp. TaxID=1872629 RepID=UPI003D0467FD